MNDEERLELLDRIEKDYRKGLDDSSTVHLRQANGMLEELKPYLHSSNKIINMCNEITQQVKDTNSFDVALAESLTYELVYNSNILKEINENSFDRSNPDNIFVGPHFRYMKSILASTYIMNEEIIKEVGTMFGVLVRKEKISRIIKILIDKLEKHATEILTEKDQTKAKKMRNSFKNEAKKILSNRNKFGHEKNALYPSNDEYKRIIENLDNFFIMVRFHLNCRGTRT
ncbi:hypothetical protein MHB43_17820 [Paenibacillus sp. FSL H8-0317]|uniref:hypothetical protein n=1 Tax=Paenibacillus sp. FSL H8-0317 TaxID=2921385 RepID=UPI00324AF83E